uniref:Uncharacterized protein n=1 Tax=Anguilla anguilla TaxID=7936 RepID=A0A0E9XUF5_ANGAN
MRRLYSGPPWRTKRPCLRLWTYISLRCISRDCGPISPCSSTWRKCYC